MMPDGSAHAAQAALERQREASREIGNLALRVYCTCQDLGVADDRAWHQLTPLERASYIDAAAIAVRLQSPVIREAMNEHASIAMAESLRLTVACVRASARVGLRAGLAHLAGLRP